MYRRQPKRAARFNVIVAGPSGSGKSTLINALCGGREVASTTEWLDVDPAKVATAQPLRLRTYTEDIADPDLGHLTLRLIETCHLGDALDSISQLGEVLRYIETQYDDVLAEESRIKRNPRFTDNRVHALIYLVEPTGHGLRELDVELMRAVANRVNVIPVLAKSDTLTKAEVLHNKRLVKEDIERLKIPIFQFWRPDEQAAGSGANASGNNSENDESFVSVRRHYDSESINENEEALRAVDEAIPLALMCSSKTNADGQLVRNYPWGSVRCDDPAISDFPLLRDALLYNFMDDLKDATYDTLYEKYRTLRLSQETQNLAEAVRTPILPTASNEPTPAYITREDLLRREEETLHRDELQLQQELEARRQELRRRELELQKLEQRLRKEAN